MTGGRKEQRVAVGRGFRHRVGADYATGAGLVFHHDRLAEERRGMLRDYARHGVELGAEGADDDAHRARSG